MNSIGAFLFVVGDYINTDFDANDFRSCGLGHLYNRDIDAWTGYRDESLKWEGGSLR